MQVIMETATNSWGTIGAAGAVVVAIGRVIYGRTERGKAAARAKAIHRQQHPPSAEIVHRMLFKDRSEPE